jgi:hypothetical protein
MVSQVPSCSNIALIVLLHVNFDRVPPGCLFISEPYHFDLACDFKNHSVQFIQVNVVSGRTRQSLLLEALRLRKGNYCLTLKPEGALLSGSFNQIIRPRRSRDEKSHKQRHEKLSHSIGWNGTIIEKRSCMGS